MVCVVCSCCATSPTEWAHARIQYVTMLSIVFPFTLYFTFHFKINIITLNLFICRLQQAIPRPRPRAQDQESKTETLGIKTKTKTLLFKTMTFKIQSGDVSRPRPESRDQDPSLETKTQVSRPKSRELHVCSSLSLCPRFLIWLLNPDEVQVLLGNSE